MTSLPLNIGPYAIIDELGRGGMGVVYRAYHRQSGQKVAIKTVRIPSEDKLQGLRREIRALARLRHPGIVRIHDDGVHDGMPWYAMDLLSGKTLNSYLFLRTSLAGSSGTSPSSVSATSPVVGDGCEHTIDVWHNSESRQAAESLIGGHPHSNVTCPGEDLDGKERAPRQLTITPEYLMKIVTTCRRICRLLSYLHGEGIVHRDLKPQNIFITEEGYPVLVDFGLMVLTTERGKGDPLEVIQGPRGTVSYMAPEQIRGDVVDARSDLYSLGCILYELLTGHPPFIGVTIRQILDAHVRKEPVPPSKLIGGLPTELDNLVLRLLSKNPQQRLGYADSVSEILANLGGENGFARDYKARPYLYRPAFNGREEHLALILRAIDSSDSDKKRLIVLSGESGIGKTRLAIECSNIISRRGVTIITSTCRDSLSRPFEVFRPPLQTIADVCRELGPRQTSEIIGRRGTVLAEYEPTIRTLPGLEEMVEPAKLAAPEARTRLYTYFYETLRQLSRHNPILIVIDDLQWADDLSLGFLDFLVHSPLETTNRVTFLATIRAEEMQDAHEALLEAQSTLHQSLDRLSGPAFEGLVRDMLALAEAPPLFSQYLAKHSEGNPFFVAEYLHAAIDSQVLWRDERGNWQIAVETDTLTSSTDYEALTLPTSLRALITRRIERLPVEVVRTLMAAAVIGLDMSFDLLTYVSNCGDECVDSIQELVRRKLLVRDDQNSLVFSHDKIRETAVHMIPEGVLPSLHRLAAEGLERSHGHRLDDVMSRLAVHWHRAGEPERAMTCYLAAARIATKQYASSEAERLYCAFLELAPPLTREAITARNELARDVHFFQGKTEEALTVHQKAIEDARTLGDMDGLRENLNSIGNVFLRLGKMDEARRQFDEALAIARRLDEREHEAETLNYIANVDLLLGNVDQARDLMGQALGIVDQCLERKIEGKILNSLAAFYFQTGQSDEAIHCFQKALEIYRELDDKQFVGRILMNMASVTGMQGRIAEAIDLYEEAMPIVTEVGDIQLEGGISVNMAGLKASLGFIEEAFDLYERSLVINRAIGDRRLEAGALVNLAKMHFDQGRLEQALTMLRESLVVHRELGARQIEATTLSNIAEIHLEENRLDDAQETFEQALVIMRDIKDKSYEGYTRANLALVLFLQGNSTEAKRVLEEAKETVNQIGDLVSASHILRVQAMIARLSDGDFQNADRLLKEALALNEQSKDQMQIALSYAELGHLALAEGRDADGPIAIIATLATTLNVSAASQIGKAKIRLECANEAFKNGEISLLFRGTLRADLPEKLSIRHHSG